MLRLIEVERKWCLSTNPRIARMNLAESDRVAAVGAAGCVAAATEWTRDTAYMGPEFDMHDVGAVPPVADDRLLPEGLLVAGRVVCHHPFGLGVYIEVHDQYGHVDVPQISDGTVRGLEDYPPIGAAVEAHVLGYSGVQRQLRLRLRLRALRDESRK